MLEAEIAGKGGDGLFVGRVQVRVGKTDGEGVDAAVPDGRQLGTNFGLVERMDDAQQIAGDAADKDAGDFLGGRAGGPEGVFIETLDGDAFRDLDDLIVEQFRFADAESKQLRP